jgi:hypothetical protein
VEAGRSIKNVAGNEHCFLSVAAAGIDQNGLFAKANQIDSGIFNRRILSAADLP